jgi:hypothetical protein
LGKESKRTTPIVDYQRKNYPLKKKYLCRHYPCLYYYFCSPSVQLHNPFTFLFKYLFIAYILETPYILLFTQYHSLYTYLLNNKLFYRSFPLNITLNYTEAYYKKVIPPFSIKLLKIISQYMHLILETN